MNKKISQILFIVAVTIIISSCGKKAPKEAKYIPKDASAVVVVNPKSLEDKLKSGNLTIDSLMNRYKDIFKELSAEDKLKWDEFKNSGVSFEDNIYLFVTQKGSLKDGTSSITNLMLNLKDEAKFEKFIKEQKEFKAEDLVKEKNFSYLSENSFALAWNKDVVILSYAYFSNPTTAESFDSSGFYIEPDKTKLKEKHKNEIASYFSLKEKESIASVSYFNDMFKSKSDGYLFSSTASALGYLSATPLNIPKLQELLQDNYSIASFNFEKGQVVMSSTTYTNPMLSSILKKYSGSKVNTHLIQYFPTQNLNGGVLISFNPEIFDGILKELEIKGMLEGFLTQVGLTSSDVFKALKGEFNIAFADFALETKEVTTPNYDGTTYKSTQTNPSYKLIVTAPVGDKVAFAKLMNLGVSNGYFEKTATGYKISGLFAAAGFYFYADDKTLVFSNGEDVYNTYVANKTKSNINSNILSEMEGKSMAAYVDFNSILNGTTKGLKDTTALNAINLVNATFKNFISTSEGFSGKSFSSKVEVNLVNEKENSLVSIVNMIDGVIKIIKEDKIKKEDYAL